MTVPNIPANKFVSVLFSAAATSTTGSDYVLDAGAVNVANIAQSPDDGDYLRFTLTQPVAFLRALGAFARVSGGFTAPNGAFAADLSKSRLIPNDDQTLVTAIDVVGYTNSGHTLAISAIDTGW
jgi:hypothetical protein